MKIMYEGREVSIEKREFYCKAGAYTHKSRIGWVLVEGGKVVEGDRVSADREWGSESYEYPAYRTRKELIASVEDENEMREWSKK